jgi:hypothetical protein
MDRLAQPDRRARITEPRDVIGAPARSAVSTALEAAADAAAADLVRRQLRERGIVPLEPDPRIGTMVGPEERVVAVRHDVSLERRRGWRQPDGGIGGDLYVTTRRLVHLGPPTVEYPLADVREVVVATGALRMVVAGNLGVEIRVRDPRVLRVEIAAAREAARAVEDRTHRRDRRA